MAGCLTLSIVLHLLVLDALSLPANGGEPPVLQARLVMQPLPVMRAAENRAEQEATALAPPVALPAMASKPVRSAQPAAGESGEVQLTAQAPSAATGPEPGEGRAFRPLNLEEARVAYRLALLAAMPEEWPMLPGGRLKLELVFREGGYLEGVRILEIAGSETSAGAWQALVASAAAQTAPPGILGDAAFRLELELLD